MADPGNDPQEVLFQRIDGLGLADDISDEDSSDSSVDDDESHSDEADQGRRASLRPPEEQVPEGPEVPGPEDPLYAARRSSLASLDEYSQRFQSGNDQGSAVFNQTSTPRVIWRSPDSNATRFRQDGMADRTMVVMNELRNNGQLCDVTLVAGSVEVAAHRSILAASSPYFYAMFTGFQEKYKDKVTLMDVDPEALQSLVNYCYQSEIVVSESNVQALLPAANLLQMNDVREGCCEFLKAQICTSNAIGFRDFGDIHGCVNLVQFCDSFINTNFVKVSDSEEFKNLSKEGLMGIISRNELNVPHEEKVYEAAINWIHHNLENRKDFIADVMQHIRLPLLSKEYLVKNVLDKKSLLSGNPECNQFIIEAMRYHMTSEVCGANSDNEDISLIKLRPRQPAGHLRPKLMLAIGGQAPKAIRSVEGYDFKSEKWIQFSEMTTRRCRCGVAVVKGRVYTVGGFNGSLRVRTVDEYDPIHDMWTSVASMEARRSTLGVAVLNHHIYAVGGFDGSMGLKSAEVLDLSAIPPSSNSRKRSTWTEEYRWRTIASMQTRRSSVGVGSLGGLIYAVGGYDGNSRQCLQTVEVYHPEEDVWKHVADMSARRSGAAVGVLGGLLYAVGGHDGPIVRQSVECYNPTTNTWTIMADMNNCRRNAGIVSHQGLLYVIGGDDGSQNLTSVEVYDPKKNQWTTLPSSMTLGRSYTGVCVIDKMDGL